MTERRKVDIVAEPIIYMDRSEVRAGKLPELKAAIAELAGFIEANEPRVLSYNVYFSDDGTRMTVIHVHPDVTSLEVHMKVAGPKFPAFAGFIRLQVIEIFGNPSETVLAQLAQKAQVLGTGVVLVHDRHAGFTRP